MAAIERDANDNPAEQRRKVALRGGRNMKRQSPWRSGDMLAEENSMSCAPIARHNGSQSKRDMRIAQRVNGQNGCAKLAILRSRRY